MVCPTGPSREGSARPSPLIFNLLRSRVFEPHRGNCRGGPPWPPFVKSEKLAATKGGHGGRPYITPSLAQHPCRPHLHNCSPVSSDQLRFFITRFQ
jgi:hypothetical protein